MDIVSSFRPLRLIELGGERYWIRPLDLEGLSMILAWLDDVLPGQAERQLPPKISDEASQAALNSLEGWRMLCWVALRHSGLSPDAVDRKSVMASGEQQSRVLTVLFSRRRTIKLGRTGEDISEGWWGPTLAAMWKNGSKLPHDVGKLSLDQLDALIDEGLPQERPGFLSVGDVQKMWEEQRARDREDNSVEASG